MNIQLRNALKALKGAGAQGLPQASIVEEAKEGTEWAGRKHNGDSWSLIKNKIDSYNSQF